MFLHENNRNYNSCLFSYKVAFILLLCFLTNRNQESRFQQVGGLVTRNISVFCLYRVALYFKDMPNSIDFYKGIFLRVIPVHPIVPRYNENENGIINLKSNSVKIEMYNKLKNM